LEDRRKAVTDSLRDNANEEFEYGVIDCMRFANSVAMKITGIDYSEGFEYHSEKEAYKLIRKAGGFSGLVSSLLGSQPVGFGSLLTGDPVLCELPTIGELMGVKMDELRIVVKTKSGTIFIDESSVIHGWAL